MSATMIAVARDKQAKAKAHREQQNDKATSITHTNPFDAPPPSETISNIKASVVAAPGTEHMHTTEEAHHARAGPTGKNVIPPKQINKNHVHCH